MEALDAQLPDEDAELLRGAWRGEAGAFERLMDRHQDRLFRLAVVMVGNPADAEDVLQETLVGVFRGAGKFAGRSSVKTWMTGILALQAARFWRDVKRRRLRSLESDAGLADGAGQQGPVRSSTHTQGVDDRIDLLAAMKKLSMEHRQIVALREFEGMSYEQIAAALSVPMGTVESRLSRARGELRAILKDYQP